ncbi:cytochrome c1 [Beggiatoa leptomitoformis]|uniref:Cytochrome c1 n=1 Tax=Beggiatoa leptomitoformis TaxID=288004 RepID=A0A2N9YH86_9GAMM|nr:cytochrome c1 [Beggiatoa leptomitoformis]ALG67967.1 cytochrome c1 [Beggiatoa leptomitoformis]AUI69755.1 cytochrome c1 [Beggiatoa leptomitoformis]
MKKLLLSCLLLLPTLVLASEGIALQHANNDVYDKASLQNGAKLFTNYCMGCHSLQYSRFQRVAKDLEIPEDIMKANLMFTSEKIGELMTIGMRKKEALSWFGVAPPDLSVIARARGTDWIYSFLLSFYVDESKPTGVNNLIFKDTAMPHVLWELQGYQMPIYEEVTDEEGKKHQVLESLEPINPAGMTDEESKRKQDDYRRTVRDLVNFLDYVGEPAKFQRHYLGIWVLLFLAFLFVFAYALKKEFWRDVH